MLGLDRSRAVRVTLKNIAGTVVCAATALSLTLFLRDGATIRLAAPAHLHSSRHHHPPSSGDGMSSSHRCSSHCRHDIRAIYRNIPPTAISGFTTPPNASCSPSSRSLPCAVVTLNASRLHEQFPAEIRLVPGPPGHSGSTRKRRSRPHRRQKRSASPPPAKPEDPARINGRAPTSPSLPPSLQIVFLSATLTPSP